MTRPGRPCPYSWPLRRHLTTRPSLSLPGSEPSPLLPLRVPVRHTAAPDAWQVVGLPLCCPQNNHLQLDPSLQRPGAHGAPAPPSCIRTQP